jgi:hypothetical protein
MNDRQPQNFWPPLVAGNGLGRALMGMFLFTGHGLDAWLETRRGGVFGASGLAE